jgi:L-asparaginase
VEVKDDDYGTVASYELNPQKARILLALALQKRPSNAELQRMFKEY